MIIEELAYKVTVRAEEFLSGKKKVEEGAKDLGENVTDAMGDVEKSTKSVSAGVKKVGDQVRKTADDTKRPFGFISAGFFGAAKGAKEFGEEGREAFRGVQSGAAKFLGLALSIEGTRRLFTSSTNSLVDLGNASSFLDLDPKVLDGWKKGAESVGSSAEAITSALMKLKNAKNWSVSGMGAPDDFTQAILQLGNHTSVDIIGAKDPGEMFKKVEEALRKLPKEQASTYIQRLGYDTSLLPSILDGSLDKNQGKFQSASNVTDEMMKKAREVKSVMGELDQVIQNLGNDIVIAFGGDAIEAMKEFDSWVVNNKDNILGFFREGADWAKKMADAVGGTSNALNILLAIKNPYLAAGVYAGRKANEISETVTELDGTESFWESLKGRWKAGGWYNYEQQKKEKAKKAANQDTQSASAGEFHKEALMNAVMMVESRGNPNRVSPAGAIGPYQIMPATGRDLGLSLEDLKDPVKSRAGAMKYLNMLINRYNGDVQLALMAYNGGMGRIDNHRAGKGKPLKPETIEYPGKVLGYYEQLSQYASMSGMPTQSQNVDNSRSQATHINNVNVNTNPQSVDAIQKSIEDQLRRSSMTGAFISGNG
ncbi:lytic transglycosylase domain-containing protein [Yersinia nurmii]|uniref:Lytic transglycosylase domain-containing protein n=1 Tax=Yersinia nurmii TaxID=685706 RepID=A0AAW7K2Y1_9GAMM|nr:lytic transglycosylase domain-containing protein [Yersinia nurmii]MDN0088331.1 lytic transglycosylase domain-containing protein [Yersinia nurmii]